ncbi:hypothetical protein [Mycobacterium sp.]|uniref:hypothetical protein n=1 Tax=Mycobacterium sp. TaxID=1785 RepID=UPI0037CAA244
MYPDSRADTRRRRDRVAAWGVRVHGRRPDRPGCRYTRSGCPDGSSNGGQRRRARTGHARRRRQGAGYGPARLPRLPWPGACLPRGRLTRLWEHHGVLELPDGSPRPALGEQLTVIPNHVCATVNLVDELVAGDTSWPVTARGRNS